MRIVRTLPGEALLDRGKLSHPLVAQARSILKQAQATDNKILWTRESCLDIRVSKASLDRALKIMAGLIGALEDRAFTVAVEARRDEKQVQTFTKIYEQAIRFGLTEKVDRVEIAAPPKGGLLERVLTYGGKPVTLEPSGRLLIEVWTAWAYNRRSWKDGKTQTLEQQLPQVVAGLMRFALADRADARQRAAEEHERQRMAEERANVERAIKIAQSKVSALRNATARWVRAGQIRSFVSAALAAAVQSGEAVDAGSSFADWVLWAEDQADRLDPLKESPPSIIDRKAKFVTRSSSYYGYGTQRPDPVFRLPKPLWKMK